MIDCRLSIHIALTEDEQLVRINSGEKKRVQAEEEGSYRTGTTMTSHIIDRSSMGQFQISIRLMCACRSSVMRAKVSTR
jgi:hypothetical protein